jgi:hypothetical protein
MPGKPRRARTSRRAADVRASKKYRVLVELSPHETVRNIQVPDGRFLARGRVCLREGETEADAALSRSRGSLSHQSALTAFANCLSIAWANIAIEIQP